MRQINEKRFLLCITFLLLLPSCTVGSASTDFSIWNAYSAEQKKMSIAGFVHCYRTVSSSNNAFAESDDTVAARMVDEATKSAKEGLVGQLILQSLKKAPRAKADVHAEHWPGPYGFASGMWWRNLDDQNREAYVQGVFWCAETSGGVAVSVNEKSVHEAVKKLNDWYVVSDEDWKDPRSNTRVDVPVVLAMERNEILSIKK